MGEMIGWRRKRIVIGDCYNNKKGFRIYKVIIFIGSLEKNNSNNIYRMCYSKITKNVKRFYRFYKMVFLFIKIIKFGFVRI